MKTGNFNRIKRDIESGLTKVLRVESTVVPGKLMRFFINETSFMPTEFSEKQIAYLVSKSTILHHVSSYVKEVNAKREGKA